MPLDLKIVTIPAAGRLTANTWPNPDFVDGDYALVQLLYKNLMTDPGEDEHDPEWGSALLSTLRGIAGNYVDEASRAATRALVKAEIDLQGSYGLSRLSLKSLTFDKSALEWAVDVLVETATGNLTVGVAA